MANGLPWTEEGDRLAIRLYAEGYNCGAIAKAVSRIMHPVSADAVNNRLLRIGVYKPKPPESMKFWTEQRVEQLTKMYNEGLSCSEIARRLGGGCSRNSVIGKVHRLKLPLRVVGLGRPRKELSKKEDWRFAPKTLKPLTQVRKIAQLIAEPLPPADVNDVARVKSLFDLEPHHCRWPVDVEGQKWPGYCGDQKVIGLSYCANHIRRAFQVGQSRQSKVAAQEVAAHKHQKESVDA